MKTHSLSTAVISLLALLPALAACQPGAPVTIPPTVPPVTIAPVTPVAPTETPIGDPQALVIKAINEIEKQTYRYSSSTVIGEETHPTTVEFVPPDRFHFLFETGEYIVIPPKVFQKVEGSWSEAPFGSEKIIPSEGSPDLEKTIHDVQFIRTDKLEGVPVLVFRYLNHTTVAGVTSDDKVEVWIGAQDGLVYKMITDGKIYAIDEKGNSSATQALATVLFTYKVKIEIEAPELSTPTPD